MEQLAGLAHCDTHQRRGAGDNRKIASELARYHPSEALTIKVKIKIVTNQKTRPMEKKKSKARSFLNMLGHFLLNMDGAGPMQAYPRHIRYSRL